MWQMGINLGCRFQVDGLMLVEANDQTHFAGLSVPPCVEGCVFWPKRKKADPWICGGRRMVAEGYPGNQVI
jgi:hypothetical protein